MDQNRYRQVIQDAINGEIQAKQFYQNVSERIRDDYLKELFSGFAAEEAKHEQILSTILEKGKMSRAHFDFTKDFRVSETVSMPEVNDDMDLKSAIALAMKNEEAAMLKYTALADNCDDPELKAVFQDLAAMERGHKHTMENAFVDVAYPEVW